MINSCNGKPKATAMLTDPVTFGLPLDDLPTIEYAE